MLRINLLPPYVFDKQKKTKVWAAWIVGVLIVIGSYAFANSIALAKQADADAENDLRSAVLAFMDDVRAAEKAVAARRVAELDVDMTAGISADEWRAAWPTEVADDIDFAELVAVEPEPEAEPDS